MNTASLASPRCFRTGISTLVLKSSDHAQLAAGRNYNHKAIRLPQAAPRVVQSGEHRMNTASFASLLHFPTGISTLVLKRIPLTRRHTVNEPRGFS
jgi:hypothetical protein